MASGEQFLDEDSPGHRRSPEAELATRAAIDLAGATNSELHIVYVGVLPRFLDNGLRGRDYNRMVYEKFEEESAEMLRKLTWQVQAAGGTVAGAHLRMGEVSRKSRERVAGRLRA